LPLNVALEVMPSSFEISSLTYAIVGWTAPQVKLSFKTA
jgi:hypothetical protein